MGVIFFGNYPLLYSMILRDGALRVVWTQDAPLSVVRRIFPAGPRRQLFFRLPVIRELSWWFIRNKANTWTPNLPAEKKLVGELSNPLAYLISRPGQDGRLIAVGFNAKQLVFVKYALGKESQRAICREQDALKELNGHWRSATVPVTQMLLQNHGLVLNDIGERNIFVLWNHLTEAINRHVIQIIKKESEPGCLKEASHAGWTLEALAERLTSESKIAIKDYNSLI